MQMVIRAYEDKDTEALFNYWKKVGTTIPFFFPVSLARWQSCMFSDMLDGEYLFDHLETFIGWDSGNITGFIQFGFPKFIWDVEGRKRPTKPVGVIRQLYFDRDQPEMGEGLIACAARTLCKAGQRHAFYHILGMTCNASHGKLHASHDHVEELMLKHGYTLEHENLYYLLDMEGFKRDQLPRISLHKTHDYAHKVSFSLMSGTKNIGSASVLLMDHLTDNCAEDAAYLQYIGLEAPFRGKGIGSTAMNLLVMYLRNREYRYLHTDTSSVNSRAQHYYETLGFEQKGKTRSYLNFSMGASTDRDQ